MSIIKISDFDIATISENTVFVLDTNVLYYVHSGYYLPSDPKGAEYSNLIMDILNNDYTIVVSALSVQELLFGIENKEHLIYCQNNGLSPKKYTKKDHRKNASEKLIIKAKLKTVLAELAPYKLCDSAIHMTSLNNFVDEFHAHKMDPIDYILVNNYDTTKTIFVSDDKDFQSMPMLQVLTA